MRGGAHRADRAERLESCARRRRAALARRSSPPGDGLALEGNVSLLAGLLQRAAADAADNLCAGLLHVAAAASPRAVWPGRGMLSSEAIAVLGGRFPPARIYSATELEQYAACPFRYFLERVLHVEPLEELALEIDYLERGPAARTRSWRRSIGG